jgi:signal transduction histidine kinase/CheY-like chemotaxis protein
MTAPASPEPQLRPPSDGPKELFGYLHELLLQGSVSTLEAPLRRLAEIFDADGVGLNSLPSSLGLRQSFIRNTDAGSPAHLPWEESVAFLQTVVGAGGAAPQTSASGSWLVSQVWEPRFGEPLLVWLWRASKAPWPPEAAAALPLAGQTLARLAFHGDLSADEQARAWHLAYTRRQLERAALVTGRLSHDFGNVLTGIMGFTELSLTLLAAGTPAAGYMREVLDAAQQGAGWLQKLHHFCRRTVSDIWPAPLDVLVVEQQKRLAQSASLKLTLDIPEDLPLLAIDAEALKQVLTQLIDNAREAVRTAGTVAVAARPVELTAPACFDLLGTPKSGRCVELTVRDSGPGLSPEARARLFTEVFYSTKPRYRGLGLLMVFGILQRFGGGFRFDPPTAEGGTTVRAYLPVADIAGAGGAEDLRGARILVVIDDLVLRRSFHMLLTADGYDVTPAAGGHEALALLQTTQTPFALMLTEVRLAHLSGFELARRLQERDPAANFLFVQMHAFPSQSRDERLRPFELLSKPFDPPTLLSAVRNALRRPPRRAP